MSDGQRALELAERARGESVVLRAAGRGPEDAARSEAMFVQQADRQLTECARRFEDYSERVFAHLHAFSSADGEGTL